MLGAIGSTHIYKPYRYRDKNYPENRYYHFYQRYEYHDCVVARFGLEISPQVVLDNRNRKH